MFEYKFIRIKVSFWSKPKEDHHKVIAENTKKGWRLVQIFAPGIGGYGVAKYFELIFEKRIG